MAIQKIGIEFDPVRTQKVDRELARLQSRAKGVDFGGGARSLDKLSRPLGKITGQATEFQKSLEASNARVLAFGASVAVINKLSEAFQQLVNQTIKVEAQFAKINVILGGTQKEIEAFGRGIFDVAKRTGTSFDQVAEGALELARQGLGVEESLSRVSTALKLVRVAGIDSQQAVAGLTAAIKGFEGAGLKVAVIGDKLAEVDTKFAVSTEDLINGLERASASARVAGVSFDELLAAVTTVQERTQRGGAVIGNAFKTIFARLGRTETLKALEQLGIDVLDAEGNVRAAVPLFQDLAVKLDQIGVSSLKAGEVIQKVAGVRQRDILINLIEDLNSGQSKFAKALQVSENAVGSLDRKNEELNKTLEALINNLAVSGQELASTLGELGFTDAAKDILKAFSSIVKGITDTLQGDSIGAKFAQGLVKGIGSVLTGPGLGLVGAIFLKLFIDLSKFGVSSLKSLLGINAASQAQAALQKSVLQSLLQNEQLQRSILNLEGDKLAQEQLLLKVYNQQANALNRVQKIAQSVTPGLFGSGMRGGPGGVGKKGSAAGGYVAAEARDVSRGVGGAKAGSKVVSIPNFAFGGGQKGTMVANTSEYYVPNYAGGGDAIFNQNMIKSMGVPPGAKKIRGAGGFIPNFARKKQNINAGPFGFLIPERTAIKKPLKPRTFSIGNSDITLSGGRASGLDPLQTSTITDTVENRIRDSVIDQSMQFTNELKPLGRSVSRQEISQGFSRGGAGGAYGALQSAIGSAFEIGITKALDFKSASREKGGDFDVRGGSNLPKIQKLFNVPGMNIGDFKVSDSYDNTESYYRKILKEKAAGAFSASEQKRDARKIATNQVKQKYGAYFTDKGDIRRQGVSGDQRNKIQDLINRTSNTVYRSRFSSRGATGYIPNYAIDPLSDAIDREKKAGIPINQIRVNQSGKLRNAQNPDGLAVTNTRDEPTGRIPNFARGGGDNFFGGLTGAAFALQLAMGSLLTMTNKNAEEMDENTKRLQVFGEEVMNAVNTLIVLSVLGVFKGGGAGGVMGSGFGRGLGKAKAGGAIGTFGTGFARGKSGRGLAGINPKMVSNMAKFGNFLGKGALMFGKFLPMIGGAILAFQVLSGVVKAFTGKGIFQSIGDALKGPVDKNKEALEKLPSALDKFRDSLIGTSLSANESVLIDKELELLSLTSERDAKIKKQIEELGTVAPANIGTSKTNKQGVIERKTKEEQEKIREKVNAEYVVATTKLEGEIKALTTQVEDQKRSRAQRKAELADVSLISGDQAAVRSAQNFARQQVQLDTFGTQGRSAQINRQLSVGGLGKNAKMQLEFESQKLKLQNDQQKANLKIEQSLIDQLKLADNFAELDQAKLDALLNEIDGNFNLETIKERLEALNLSENFNSAEAFKNLQKQVEAQKILNQGAKDLLDTRQQQTKAIEEQKEGLAGYINTNKETLDKLERDFPKTAAENFEDAMNTAFSNLESGGVKSFGDFLGQIAVQFGKSLLEEQRKIAVKRIATGAAESSFGKKLFNVFGGGEKKAAGGMIQGGGGVVDDVPALLTGGEFVMKKSAVQRYGVGFMNKLNAGSVPGFNSGGSVFSFNTSGGYGPRRGSEDFQSYESQYTDGTGLALQGADNVRTGRFFDDPEGNMFGGALSDERLARARATEFFTPGEMGAGTIVGKENLLAFSQQQFTSGSRDLITSGPGGGAIDLELQSRRLTAFGRRRMSPARQRLRESQEQAYELAMASGAEEERVLDENKAARKARTKALQNAIKMAFVDATLAGVNAGMKNVEAGGKFFGKGVDPGLGEQGLKMADGTSALNLDASYTNVNADGFVTLTQEGVAAQASSFKAAGMAPSRAAVMVGQGVSQGAGSSFSSGLKAVGKEVLANLGGGNFITQDNLAEVSRTNPSAVIQALPYLESTINQGTVSNLITNNPFVSVPSNQPSTPVEYQSDTAEQPTSMFQKGYAFGGMGTRGNALLTAGEFVVDRVSASRIGRDTLEDINTMRYANGGSVGTVAPSAAPSVEGGSGVENVNITINVDKDGNASAESDMGRDSEKAAEFSKKVKDVVLNVIQEEKRVSGSLFTRNK